MNYKITDIKILKTKTYIFFDNSTKLVVNPNVVVDLYLYKGKQFDNYFYKKIKEYSKEENLFDYVLNKFKVDSYTSGKTRELLIKKGANKKQITNIITRLKRSNLLNDERFVSDCLEYANYKNYGYNKIIKKLYDLKVSNESITKVKYDENREIYCAEQLAKKNLKKYADKNEAKQKQLLISLLVRNGFDSTLSTEIIEKIVVYDKKHEINVLKLEYVKSLKRFKNKYNEDVLTTKVREYLLKNGFKLSDIKSVEENI